MPTCPHCGHEADASDDECPLCGTPLAGPGEGEAPAAGGRSGPAADARAGASVPWEDPNLGFVVGIWRTWRESLFEPAGFFGRVRDEGTVVRPLLYYLLVTVAASFAALVWEAQGLTIAHLAGYVQMGERAATGPAVSFVLAPFAALVAVLILTMVFHLGALMVAPERRGMGATARVVCYAAGPSLLAAVPIVGAPVGAVWSLVLQVVGLREVHRTTTFRAVFMVFWLWFAFAVFGILLAVLVAWMGGPLDGGVLVFPGAVPAGVPEIARDALRAVPAALAGA